MSVRLIGECPRELRPSRAPGEPVFSPAPASSGGSFGEELRQSLPACLVRILFKPCLPGALQGTVLLCCSLRSGSSVLRSYW